MYRYALFVAAASVASPALAGANSGFIFSAVPTLDELGLGLLIALVAGVAGWAVRRRNRP